MQSSDATARPTGVADLLRGQALVDGEWREAAGVARFEGLGREGGRHAIAEFTDLKYVCAAPRPL